MRRSEFLSSDLSEFEEITGRAHTGYLGIMDYRGFPRIVPLNFVALDGDIYMHGAQEGEKYELMSSRPKASFSVDLPYALIPSYFTSKKSAVPTSYFFKSIHIRGNGSVIEDISLKAKALQAMMEKYQPEGRYTKITPENKIYKGALKEVAVFKVENQECTIKLKFGQNMNIKQINQVIAGLEERGLPADFETIEMIRKYRKD